MEKAKNNHCPVHPEQWLYYDLFTIKGFCRECGEWYILDVVVE